MKPFNHQPSPHALSLIGNPNYAKLNYAKVWQLGKICAAEQYIRTIFSCNDDPNDFTTIALPSPEEVISCLYIYYAIIKDIHVI
jgi:hypothetical protein